MDPNLEKLMGRGKSAAGALKDDDDLKREGRLDQFSGDVKAKGHAAVDHGSHGLDRGVDRAKDFVHRRT